MKLTTKTPGTGGHRGRPFSVIKRAQFNVNLPVDMIEWLRLRSTQTRRRLNIEVEELLRAAAEGELEFIYTVGKQFGENGSKKIKLKKR